MPTYSVRVSDDLADDVEAFIDAYDGSKSDALCELLKQGTAYEDIQSERDALQNQLQTFVEQREEHQELVEYVEEEKTRIAIGEFMKGRTAASLTRNS